MKPNEKFKLTFRPHMACMKPHLMSASEAVLGRPSGQHGHCRRPVGVEGKRNGLWMLPVLLLLYEEKLFT